MLRTPRGARQQREAEEAQYYQELDQAAAGARARPRKRIASLASSISTSWTSRTRLYRTSRISSISGWSYRRRPRAKSRRQRASARSIATCRRRNARLPSTSGRRKRADAARRRRHQAIITNMTSVFSLMAQGQADAAQAGEPLLAGFLQYISQRATVEALAQVAQALGSYPDMGGMALHFAAAAGWAAVAVASGVGGAALQSDAQSKAQAAQAQQSSKPAEPSGGGGNEKGGSNTYVITGTRRSSPARRRRNSAAPCADWLTARRKGSPPHDPLLRRRVQVATATSMTCTIAGSGVTVADGLYCTPDSRTASTRWLNSSTAFDAAVQAASGRHHGRRSDPTSGPTYISRAGANHDDVQLPAT